jgi:hypothetical protein
MSSWIDDITIKTIDVRVGTYGYSQPESWAGPHNNERNDKKQTARSENEKWTKRRVKKGRNTYVFDTEATLKRVKPSIALLARPLPSVPLR